MTLQETRDMFAATAMQSLMRDPAFQQAEPEDIAAAAYEQAEAMLVERARRAAEQRS